MKKIVRQQNYLKELIEAQENRFLSKEALRSVVRGILEPLLDKPEEGVVLHRIVDKEGIIGLIKRLEFSEVEALDFTDGSENLREKVWANTEFICVLTHRFVAILLWDNNTDDKNFVRYYSIYNSKLQNEALDIINRNSILDLRPYQERFKPDRRDNRLLNASIRRLIENLDENSKDAVLGFAEVNTTKNEYTSSTREVAHEVKNQLSICDLYTEIIDKYCAKNGIEEETISNAVKSIKRALRMANNSLISLKSSDTVELKPLNLKELIFGLQDLTKVYFECKNIEYIVENEIEANILCDENKLTGVLINLVKNAVEAFGFEENDVQKNGKYIKIKTSEEDGFALISVSNNAGEINSPERIFEKGFTTKTGGSGLGLGISRKSMEEQMGGLSLAHTGADYTEFIVKIGLV